MASTATWASSGDKLGRRGGRQALPQSCYVGLGRTGLPLTSDEQEQAGNQTSVSTQGAKELQKAILSHPGIRQSAQK